MTILQILFYCFVAIAVIQALYYLGFLNYFATQKPSKGKSYNIALSVIICAKNEDKNLKHNLPKIINQDYKNFEIVLINDSSYDDTLEVMESF